MSRSEAVEEYGKALKEGQKEYKDCLQKEISPYPAVLDELLEAETMENAVSLGLLEIPMHRIVGTSDRGYGVACHGYKTFICHGTVTLDTVLCIDNRHRGIVLQGHTAYALDTVVHSGHIDLSTLEDNVIFTADTVVIIALDIQCTKTTESQFNR